MAAKDPTSGGMSAVEGHTVEWPVIGGARVSSHAREMWRSRFPEAAPTLSEALDSAVEAPPWSCRHLQRECGRPESASVSRIETDEADMYAIFLFSSDAMRTETPDAKALVTVYSMNEIDRPDLRAFFANVADGGQL